MFWVVASIAVVVAGTVLGGLLCLWCAFTSHRRFRVDTATLSLYSASPPVTTRPITIVPPKHSSTSPLIHTLMREPFIVPTMLPVCCVCRLIRDDTRFSPGRTLWVTQRAYQKTHGVNPSDLALTHTYCPTCFTKVQGAAWQDFQETRTAP